VCVWVCVSVCVCVCVAEYFTGGGAYARMWDVWQCGFP